MVAGVWGFDGLMGIVFYFAVDLIVGALICLKLGLRSVPYFTSLQSVLTSGLMGNVMTFMVVWVLFHNLVYVL